MATNGAVHDNKAQHQFQMDLDDGQKAVISYSHRDRKTVDLQHTEVPQQYKGQGIGKKLVEGTLQLVQADNMKVVPTCKFVARYIQEHPEYQSMVA